MRVSNLVPEVYYKDSRDFSYVGRLFEIIFNYLKTNADLVGKSLIDVNISSNLLDLAMTTLGFESKHEYQSNDLVALCSSFVWLLKRKGSIEAIEDAIKLLLNAQNIVGEVLVERDSFDPHKYHIVVPKDLEDIVLLEDIFDYILPVGSTYVYSRGYKPKNDKFDISIGVSSTEDDISIYKMRDYQLGQVGGRIGTLNNDGVFNTNENIYGNDANRSMQYTGVVVGSTLNEEEE